LISKANPSRVKPHDFRTGMGLLTCPTKVAANINVKGRKAFSGRKNEARGVGA
jgi:hypothetical protein